MERNKSLPSLLELYLFESTVTMNDTSRAMSQAVAVQTAFPYSIKLWLCICAFLVILSISHIITSLVYYLRRRGTFLSERNSLNARVLRAILNVSRIVMCRITVSTGYYRWNVTEGCVVLGYLLALLVWEFINCRISKNCRAGTDTTKFHPIP